MHQSYGVDHISEVPGNHDGLAKQNCFERALSRLMVLPNARNKRAWLGIARQSNPRTVAGGAPLGISRLQDRLALLGTYT